MEDDISSISILGVLYQEFKLASISLDAELSILGVLYQEFKNIKMVESGKARASKKGRKGRNCGIGNEIWKDFPEDLFEGVLARVPIATFFRFRSVCRKWNSLLTSQSFTQQYGEVKHAKPWFYGITNESEYTRTGAVYDPSSNKWRHPTLPAFPTKMSLFPVASAGGLICFADYSHRSFYVCNPLTRSFKELPARCGKPEWPRIAVGMTQMQNGGYKILCVGSEGDFQVLDSANNSWISPGSMPPSIKLPLALRAFMCEAVSIEGRLYFMQSGPDRLLSYEVNTGMWRQYIVPNPPHMSLRGHTVAESEGRIMLVGLLKENAASCVCIWELEMTTLLWNEVDRMPNKLCLEFHGKKNVTMSCLGNKALLMLSLATSHMNRLFTYHLSTREWRKLHTRTQ
ncbi:F-box only protein 6-like [Salvia splendens]|uniref:F-box only protein 6-like n=1 Tax=Salvia splendens TaxID=180675 RepID=UPI001C25947C|nr:F-box only protein 6-like [Salvia splendens]